MQVEVTTEKHHLAPYSWKSGQSGNPKGRPKGARSKLGEQFLEAMQKDFEANGAIAIEKCRIENTPAYLAIIAKILPQEINVTHQSVLDELSVDEIRGLIETLNAAETRIIEGSSGRIAETQVGDVPTVHEAEIIP